MLWQVRSPWLGDQGIEMVPSLFSVSGVVTGIAVSI